MSGSFLISRDILFDGSLETGIVLDSAKLKDALHQIRETYFRHRALYRGMNGDAFGDRLRKLVDDRVVITSSSHTILASACRTSIVCWRSRLRFQTQARGC